MGKGLVEDVYLSLWGLFVSAFISSTIAPGGSEAVLAFMVSSGNFSVANLIVVATVGNSLGALTTWFLGWLAEKKFPLEKVLERRKQKSISLVRKWGVWALLFSWLPVIGDGLCFAGGWLRLAFWPACLAIVIGKSVRYTVLAFMFI